MLPPYSLSREPHAHSRIPTFRCLGRDPGNDATEVFPANHSRHSDRAAAQSSSIACKSTPTKSPRGVLDEAQTSELASRECRVAPDRSSACAPRAGRFLSRLLTICSVTAAHWTKNTVRDIAGAQNELKFEAVDTTLSTPAPSPSALPSRQEVEPAHAAGLRPTAPIAGT